MKARVRLNLRCETCGYAVVRRKTFPVASINTEAASEELRPKVAEWKRSLTPILCASCKSVWTSLLSEPTSGS